MFWIALGAQEVYRDLVLSHGPASYWRLGETTGIVAQDQVGGRNLNFSPAAGNVWTGGTLGQQGAVAGDTAAFFNGGKAFAASKPSSAVDNVTMECWLQHTGTETTSIIFYAGNPGGSGFGLILFSGRLQILMGGVTFVDSGVAPLQNQWEHWVIRRAAGNWSIFRNGMALPVSSSTAPNATSQATMIGSDEGLSIPFLGVVDEAAFYARALSDAEILAHYQAAM